MSKSILTDHAQMNYSELIKENEELKRQLNYIRNGEYYNQVRFERDLLQQVVDDGKVPEEDKKFLDMTHRNTELLKENKKLKETIKIKSNGFKAAITDLCETSIELENLQGAWNRLERFIKGSPNLISKEELLEKIKKLRNEAEL